MKRYHQLIFLCLLSILVCCQKQEIAENNDPKPIYLEAYLQAGKYAILHIAPTYNISDSWPQLSLNGTDIDSASAVQYYKNLNAHILLYKDGLLVDSLTKLTDNRYNFWSHTWWCLKGQNHILEEGGIYKMEVKLQGHDAMVAECTIPQKVELLKFDSIPNTKYGRYYEFTDSLSYLVQQYMYEYSFIDPPLQHNYYMIEEKACNKKHYIYPERYSDLQGYFPGNNPIFETKNAYRPFFSDKLFNGNHQTLKLDNNAYISDSLFCLNLISISEGYYKVLKSQYLFDQNKRNFYAEPTPIYNNFTNAIGFMAGLAISSDTVFIKNVQVVPNPNRGFHIPPI